jgi:hypothetical protein
MPLALNIEPEIENEVRNIAERRNVSVSTFVSDALLEKIEDEIDLERATEVKRREDEGKEEYFTLDEVAEEFGYVKTA